MKRFVSLIVAALIVATGAALAFDTSLTYHDQMLAAQSATLEKDSLLLLGPVAHSNEGSTAGSAIDVSAYAGYGTVIGALGARSGAGNTNTVAIVYGYDSSPATALVTFTQTTATAKYEEYEVDFATLKGTNAALYLKATYTNVAGDDTNTIGGAVLVFDKARTAAQVITGSAVSTAKYKGFGTIVVSIGAPSLGATNFTGVVQIQSAAASTGTWANVSGKTATATGNAAGAVTEIPYELGAGNPYIRALFTTTNDVAPVAVTINSFK
jgi:hypothetical protein